MYLSDINIITSDANFKPSAGVPQIVLPVVRNFRPMLCSLCLGIYDGLATRPSLSGDNRG
jgi:hypothetical protein